MRTSLERAALILAVAFRNLSLDKFRTSVIASLLGFGAFLAVLGLSLLSDVQTSMRESIIGSITGHLQLYSAKAKDDLAIFGGSFMGRPDIGVLPDLAPLRDIALKDPNVLAFIPMGLDMAILGRGNELDEAITALRSSLKAKDESIIGNRKDDLRYQFEQLERELAERRKLRSDSEELDRQSNDLAKALDAAFLGELHSLDETKLQFLETRIAPISGEKSPIYLRYVGTDIELFGANFPKFKVIEGEPLPQGRRGILISHRIREEYLKNLAARLFDKLHENLVKNRRRLGDDAEAKRLLSQLGRQDGQIIRQLDRAASEALSQSFTQSGITSQESELAPRLRAQLQEFLKLTDANFLDRFNWFYANIAPKIRLYEFYPGDVLTLRSYTRSGYVKSLALKVFGIYSFQGLEDSDIAGAMNIVDLVSFRELFGQMTESSRQELETMREEIGIRDINAADAEAALFGNDAPPPKAAVAAPKEGDAFAPLSIKPSISDQFAPEEITRGLALNSALRLKDPGELEATAKRLTEAFKQAGFDIKIIDWQQASGIIGQLVNIIGLALVFALSIILVVAFVIINNSIIVGTLSRTREIGTMRAIGVQRSFVVALFLAETGVTGIIGATFGTIAAIAALALAHQRGIPAPNNIVTLLFSGPRLYPSFHWVIIGSIPLGITLLATLTSIYAARHAAWIQPAEATQEKE